MKLPKTNALYWEERIQRTRGQLYTVRIAHGGERQRFDLHLSNKREAGKKAVTIYNMIVNEGWEKTLEKYKPQALNKKEEIDNPTFGDVFQAVEGVSSVKTDTRNKYIGKCRTIITAIKGIDTDNSRYRKGSEGNKKWLHAVDSTKLSEITPAKVREWRDEIINSRSAGDPNSQDGHRAKISTNSTLRQARSLFGAGCLSKLRDKGLALPDPLPFHDKNEKQNPMFSKVDHKRSQYKSVVDISSLLKDGQKELANEPENQNLWLALMLGALQRGYHAP